jgi:threonine aldolase
VREPETNFVMVDVGPDPVAATAALREHEVLLSGTLEPTVMRAVTHLDIDDDAIERAIERIASALGVG